MGVSHSSVIAKVNTKCLVRSHTSEYGKAGPGGAALQLLDEDVLLVAGGKGMAAFDTSFITAEGNLSSPSSNPKSGDNGLLPRVGNTTDTKTVCISSGCGFALRPSTDGTKLMYLVGGKGLSVVDVSTSKEPKMVTPSAIDTGATSYNGGASCVLYKEFLYVAGGKGLAVFSLSADPKRPVRIGGVINTGAVSPPGSVSLRLVESAGSACLYIVGAKGLAVLDITTDPRTPSLVNLMDTGVTTACGCMGFCGYPDSGETATGGQNLLFVGGGKGVAVLDISDAKSPRVVQKFDSGAMSMNGGCAMVTTTRNDTPTLFVAGGKGLGCFTLPSPEDLLSGSAAPTRTHLITTGALSIDNDSAAVLSGNMLYVAGGNGLSVVDLRKL